MYRIYLYIFIYIYIYLYICIEYIYMYVCCSNSFCMDSMHLPILNKTKFLKFYKQCKSKTRSPIYLGVGYTPN